MNTVKRLTKNVKLDVTSFVHDDTGTRLLDAIGEDSKMSIKENTNLFTISSDDYSIIDNNAMLELSNILNKSDIASVLLMGLATKTELNIIFNNTIPHTNKTLQKYLRLSSEAMYMRLIKRLIDIGVLYQIKGLIYNKVRVCYMLNPYVYRKRKTFEERVIAVFNDVFVKELTCRNSLLTPNSNFDNE